MTEKARGDRDITVNRRAFFEYHIEDRAEAGMVLVGSEVKSLRDGHVNLKDSYVRVIDDELWLIGMHISHYNPASQFSHAPERQRKLLLNRREIDKLATKIQEKGLTLIPLRLYWKQGRAKAEIGVGRGKKAHDKRDAIKEQTERREMARAMSVKQRR